MSLQGRQKLTPMRHAFALTCRTCRPLRNHDRLKARNTPHTQSSSREASKVRFGTLRGRGVFLWVCSTFGLSPFILRQCDVEPVIHSYEVCHVPGPPREKAAAENPRKTKRQPTTRVIAIHWYQYLHTCLHAVFSSSTVPPARCDNVYQKNGMGKSSIKYSNYEPHLPMLEK